MRRRLCLILVGLHAMAMAEPQWVIVHAKDVTADDPQSRAEAIPAGHSTVEITSASSSASTGSPLAVQGAHDLRRDTATFQGLLRKPRGLWCT